MSHPDPCYDPENSYEDDEMFLEPDESDVPLAAYLHDGNELNLEDEENDVWDDSYDDSMDGDFDSAMRDCRFGTDEDYGYYGEDY